MARLALIIALRELRRHREPHYDERHVCLCTCGKCVLVLEKGSRLGGRTNAKLLCVCAGCAARLCGQHTSPRSPRPTLLS